MDIDEVVETSDLEELAELEAARRTKSPTPFKAYDLNIDLLPRSPPRKKAKLYHEFDNDEAGKLFVSPAKSLSVNTSTPDRSQSSSTMLGTTSPAHSISRSSTRTPGSSHGASFVKVESRPPPPILSFAAPIESDSQDPLLLESPVASVVALPEELSEVDVNDPFKEIPAVERSTTPVSSPPGPQLRFPSVDPLNLFGTSPAPSSLGSPAASAEDPSTRESAKDDPDDLFMFSPVKEAFQQSSSSPLFSPSRPTSPRPLSPKSPTPQSRHRNSFDVRVRSPSPERQSDRSPSPQIGHAAQQEADRRVAEAIHEEQEQAQGGRYSLRARKDAQLKPYTIDRLRYKITLKDNPEAIIKDKVDQHRHRHPDDHYEEEETQGDNEEERRYEEELRKRALREEKRRRREEAQQSESEQGQGSVKYLGILQEDLPPSDDEEAKEIRKLSNEGRRLLKEQEKQKKAQEKGKQREQPEQETHRTKRFPVFNRASASSELSSLASHSHRPSLSNENSDDEVMVVDERKTLNPQAGPSRATQTPPYQGDLLRDYFADDDEFWTNNEGDSTRHSSQADASRPSVVQSDGEEDEEEDEGDGSELIDARLLRTLRKMWPEVMVQEYLDSLKEAAAEKKKRRTLERLKNSAASEPLRAGQSRVRTGSRPKDSNNLRIAGDPESDVENGNDSDGSSASTSRATSPPSTTGDDSDVDDILTTYGRAPPKQAPEVQVIDVDDLDHGDSDDEEVQFISLRKTQNKGAAARFRDKSLIDYMLAGPSTFKATKERSSKFKMDIMTKGARGLGRGRQGLLSFENHGKDKEKSSRSKSQKKVRSSKPKATTAAATSSRVRNGNRARAEKERQRKNPSYQAKKRKERIELQRKMGVWTKPSDGRIEKRTAFVTLDLEDEGFHHALVPSSRSAPSRKPTQHISPAQPNLPDVSLRSEASEASTPHPIVVANGKHGRRLEDIPTDFGLDPLHAGKGFATETYIRKGFLHHLINFSSTEIAQPPAATMFAIKLDSTQGLQDFSSTLSRISDAFYDFATSLPGPDDEKLSWDWSKMTHFASYFLSWYLQQGDERETQNLRGSLESDIARLICKIQELTVEAIEMPILTICWFFIELAAKLAPQPVPLSLDGRPEGLMKDAIALLMGLLLRFDLKQIMKPFECDPQQTDSVLANFVAELWVRLIHLLGHCRPVDEAIKQRNHPFWLMLMDALDLRMQSIDTVSSSFETSELVWHTIWSMCTLAQFSVHGMTTTETHLPACWDIVVLALKRIRLTQMARESCMTFKGASIACSVDRYIALLVQRCFLMRHRWHWSLVDATVMFNHTVEIFRSRKFANLLHEPDDFPRFFLEQNWELLTVYDEQDIAYVMFLKLVRQAILEDPQYAKGTLSPKVKKLLSMAVPMSSLPFSKTNPPPKHSDLAMYYNRISALAVVGDLEKGDCRERISAARRYISFAAADNDSRSAAMRGMSYWARLMVSRGMSLEAMGEWIAEMATVIKSETSQKANESVVSDATYLAEVLLNQVRRILEACVKESRYPDAILISSLGDIFTPSIIRKEELSEEFGRFASTLFEARLKALPPPPRPFLAPPPAAVEEDSQDYGDMDLDLNNLDWSATDLPEALVIPASTITPSDVESNDVKEAKLRSAIRSVHFRGIVYEFLKRYMKHPSKGVVSSKYISECDGWIHLWLSCACVEAPGDKWSTQHLSTLEEFLRDGDERWVRRINLSIMFQIISLQPTLYITFKDKAFEAFLNALVSDNNTNREGKPRISVVERQYVAQMLSIDNLHHPLLCNVGGLLPPRNPETGDYEISPEEFLALRVPLLDAIFNNLDKLLQNEREAGPNVSLDVEKHIKFCQAMFSAMRYSLTICDKSSPKYLADTTFCFEVISTLKKYPALSSRQELDFFVHTWYNALIPPGASAP